MAINFLNSVDLNTSQLLNAVIQNVGADPTSVLQGQIIYRTDTNQLKVANGTGYVQVGGSFTLRAADSTSPNNDFTVTPGSTVSLAGGTNMTVTRGGSGSENVFTVNTTATPDQTITLTGAVTGTGTGSFVTTLQQVVDTTKFVATAITKSGEDFITNAVDTQIPTTKSVYNYVNLALTGTLIFKGGFNASTGVVVSGPNTGDKMYTLDQDLAITTGDYYVATVAGNFFGDASIPLTVGDQVIADATVAAGSVTKTDFTIVQADRDLATLTTVGIGNVNASATSGIDVSYSAGTASLVVDVNEISSSTDKPSKVLGTDSSGNTRTFTDSEFFQHRFKNVSLDSSSTAISRSVSGGVTTFVVDVSNAAIFGTAGSALNTTIEILDHSDGATVYAEITRPDAAELTIAFLGTKADGDYDVLLTNVG
ncbi:MAG TPA: hypothetical protein DCY51_07650 [Bacteroidetes bacterium]|nr:hypothetical protein [Bacteroidota bacterium]